MIDDGRVRTNINRLIHWVRRVFRWGVENEHVPVSVYTALAAVPSLKEGRSDAVENDPYDPSTRKSFGRHCLICHQQSLRWLNYNC